MMARSTTVEQAQHIAENAQSIFAAAMKPHGNVTTTVLIMRAHRRLPAVKMDEAARAALEDTKEEGKGRIVVKDPPS